MNVCSQTEIATDPFPPQDSKYQNQLISHWFIVSLTHNGTYNREWSAFYPAMRTTFDKLAPEWFNLETFPAHMIKNFSSPYNLLSRIWENIIYPAFLIHATCRYIKEKWVAFKCIAFLFISAVFLRIWNTFYLKGFGSNLVWDCSMRFLLWDHCCFGQRHSLNSTLCMGVIQSLWSSQELSQGLCGT